MTTRRSLAPNAEETWDSTLPKSMALESLGSFKYTYKKKKKKGAKWTPFDYEAADSASEGGSISEMGALSRLPSPVPVTLIPISTTTSTSISTSTFTTTIPTASSSIPHPPLDPAPTFPTLQEANLIAAAPIHAKQTRSEIGFTPTVAGLSRTAYETNVAPAEDLLHLTAPVLLDLDPVILDQQHIHPGLSRGALSTQSVDDQADEAMRSIFSTHPGKDTEGRSKSYDSGEWDPTLPSASAQIKPLEAVAAPAQPISYTTVGSIIDPKAAPQFTAPNRVQREGSGRRPVLPLVQGRQHDSFYPHRGLSPFNATSTLHHAHQFDQPSNNFGFSRTPTPSATRPTRSAQLLQQLASLTEQENNILAKMDGPAAPQMLFGNQHDFSPTPMPSKKQPGVSQQSLRVGEFAGEDILGCSTNFHGPIQSPVQVPNEGPVQGLEKMQTLQRLAKFDNPMQGLALSRLSKFSVAKTQGTAGTLDNPAVAVEELLRLRDQSSPLSSTKAEASTHRVGELDRAYQFPLPDRSKSQANPLFGAFSSSTRPSNDPPLHHPGYPAPLTAGPPGHRRYQGTTNGALADYSDKYWGADPRSSTLNPYGAASAQSNTQANTQANAKASSFWFDNYNLESGPQDTPISSQGGKASPPIQDTASIEVASRYYPFGLPPDMTGNVVPLQYATQKKMGQIPDDLEPQTAEEIEAKKAAELDNWFYGGQRRFAYMTAEDHIRQYEDRQLESLNPFGPIGPRSKKPLPPTQKQPFTTEESNKMSVADATAPLLDAAFGTLLSYATPANAPDSAKVLSKFESSSTWHLDTSKNGNKSFYGEDWGAPSKGNDGHPRYQ